MPDALPVLLASVAKLIGTTSKAVVYYQYHAGEPTVEGFSVRPDGTERVRLDGFTAASSGAEIVGYRVYRNGTLLATTSSNAYADTEVKGATGYSYTVTAVDGAGNESAPSAPASSTTR